MGTGPVEKILSVGETYALLCAAMAANEAGACLDKKVFALDALTGANK